jgi:hypothetical protein
MASIRAVFDFLGAFLRQDLSTGRKKSCKRVRGWSGAKLL